LLLLLLLLLLWLFLASALLQVVVVVEEIAVVVLPFGEVVDVLEVLDDEDGVYAEHGLAPFEEVGVAFGFAA